VAPRLIGGVGEFVASVDEHPVVAEAQPLFEQLEAIQTFVEEVHGHAKERTHLQTCLLAAGGDILPVQGRARLKPIDEMKGKLLERRPHPWNSSRTGKKNSVLCAQGSFRIEPSPRHM